MRTSITEKIIAYKETGYRISCDMCNKILHERQRNWRKNPHVICDWYEVTASNESYLGTIEISYLCADCLLRFMGNYKRLSQYSKKRNQRNCAIKHEWEYQYEPYELGDDATI